MGCGAAVETTGGCAGVTGKAGCVAASATVAAAVLRMSGKIRSGNASEQKEGGSR
jgi:hypothetical protein